MKNRDESGMLASDANQYEANQYESNQHDATTGRFRRAWCDIKQIVLCNVHCPVFRSMNKF